MFENKNETRKNLFHLKVVLDVGLLRSSLSSPLLFILRATSVRLEPHTLLLSASSQYFHEKEPHLPEPLGRRDP